MSQGAVGSVETEAHDDQSILDALANESLHVWPVADFQVQFPAGTCHFEVHLGTGLDWGGRQIEGDAGQGELEGDLLVLYVTGSHQGQGLVGHGHGHVDGSNTLVGRHGDWPMEEAETGKSYRRVG